MTSIVTVQTPLEIVKHPKIEVGLDEPLQPNIVVVLYEQGVPNTPVATTTTDEEGHYLFENLPAGEYFTTLLPESLPEGAFPPSYYSAGVLDDLRSHSGLLEQGDEASNSKFGHG